MAARLVADFVVPGIPVPQGSKTARVIHTPKGPIASIYNDNDKVLKPWRKTVTAIAAAARTGERIEGAVQVVLEFRFVRPKTVKREHPTVKPDVDKLMRALLDGITDAGLWRDDSQVVRAVVEKVYADEPGVRVQVGEINPQQKESTK
jgi:Holliday junction resolvase RusA-like endonuclease